MSESFVGIKPGDITSRTRDMDSLEKYMWFMSKCVIRKYFIAL